MIGKKFGAALFVGLAASLAAASAKASSLSIDPTFGSSIASSGNAAAIETAIGNAIGFYGAFTDPVTVSIDFELAPSDSGYLGASYATYYLGSEADFASLLSADAAANSNSVEQTAYDNLASGNSADRISTTSVDLRALGVGLGGDLNSTGGTGGSYDGVILLNAELLSGFGGSGSYDPERVIQHEIDEVLGIGGAGSVLNDMYDHGLSTPPVSGGQTFIGAMDLFRYSGPGAVSLTTSGSASSYFSIDGGVTDIAPFNQNHSNDYGDWADTGCPGHVQDASSCTGHIGLNLASPETIALQAIGYDLPVPEPPTLALFGAALFGLGWSGLRRRKGMSSL